jgi:hypothetical protein
VPRIPPGVNFLAAFFVFGTAMSGLASIGLLFPGSVLEPMWRLNPESRASLASLGPVGIGLMATVSMACAAAAYGLRALSAWGHKLAVALLVVNLLGDAAGAIFRNDLWTLIGIPIGGLLIAYLLQPHVRALFQYRGTVPRGNG